MSTFEYIFPVLRGIQAKKEYYVGMYPLRLIPKIFLFDEEELAPELRAQRLLNRKRVPEISRYILNNRESYVFSSLTASIDGPVKFEANQSNPDDICYGLLHVPMSARFIINDGQHRRAAIEMALKKAPELGNESITVVLFVDTGLEHSQQMFADLNRNTTHPAKSISVLYDHRDEIASLVKLLTIQSPVFINLVEMERSTLSPRSRCLFTLSSLYTATEVLLKGFEAFSMEEKLKTASAYWEQVDKQFPEWEQVRQRQLTAGEVRHKFIHSHGIVLQALGQVGNQILKESGSTWRETLNKLSTLDWSRFNAKLWEGRAMIGGRVSKGRNNVVLTVNAIKTGMGLQLVPKEQKIEQAFWQGKGEL